MRQMICAFLFDHLDFEEITSGAFTDNPESLAVSRKVGYRDNGVRRLKRREGELATNLGLVLTKEDLVRGEHPLEVEGVAPFRRSIGLDS
jgi:RimJ/RimL family protein N-acetyltransferase